MKNKTILSAAGALWLMGLAAPAQALYCDDTYGGTGMSVLEGDTVCFLYDAADVSPLYGTLSVSGDNIFSNPDSFLASSADGGTSQTTGTGTVRVIAKEGYELNGVNVGERGNYRLSGSGSSVDVDAVLDVFDWSSPIFGTQESGNLTFSGDLTLQDGDLHTWTGSASFDLSTAMWADINDVGLTLTNILTAGTTSLGETATIEKTLAGTELISIETTVIPLPAAVWLFGSGLIGLVGLARSKKRA